MPTRVALHGSPIRVGPPVEYLRRLLQIIGVREDDAWIDTDEYMRSNQNPWDTAGGGGHARHTDVGGTYYLESTAGAATVVGQRGGTTVSNTKTKRWGIAVRFAILTTVDDQAGVGFGMRDVSGGSESIILGYGGAGAGGGNYHIQYDGDIQASAGSRLSLGLATDLLYHIGEMWCLGDNKIYGRIDGGAVASVTPTNALTSATLYRLAMNGTTAANRKIAFDWHVACGERA
jgi:hypothetical protein